MPYGAQAFGSSGAFGATATYSRQGRFGESVGISTFDLFRKGELGDFFDNSRLDLMWQDAAGTTPAVADGPVGKQIGVCGKIVRTQATAGNRLTLKYDSAAARYYLSQESVTTAHLVTATLNATAFDCVTVWAGVRKTQSSYYGTIVEFSPTVGSNNGSFALQQQYVNPNDYAIVLRGNTLTGVTTATNFAPPITNVLVIGCDISGADLTAEIHTTRVNGLPVSSTFIGAPYAENAGTGNFGNHAMYWFARGGSSLPFTGREYCSGVRFSTIPSTERELQFVNNWTTIRTPIS